MSKPLKRHDLCNSRKGKTPPSKKFLIPFPARGSARFGLCLTQNFGTIRATVPLGRGTLSSEADAWICD